MIGATDQGTVSGLANVKRATNVSSSSEEDEEGEEEEEEKDGEKRRRRRNHRVEREEDEEDGNVDDDGGGVTAFREKVPEWMSMIDSGIKLSGPVTDL